MKTRWSRIGLPLSIAIHLAILAIPLNMAFLAPARPDEKKVTLLFKRAATQFPPTPQPPRANPKPKIESRFKPGAQPKPTENKWEEQPPAGQPLSPIEAAVVGSGGIDIPSGPAYEEVYIPSPPPGSVSGNGNLAGGGTGRGGGEQPPPVDKEKLLAEYKSRVYAIILSNKNYPSLARRRSIQGAAGIAFAIRADGAATDARVIRTSNFKVLDDAAVETIVKIGRFPPLPPELGLEELVIGVSIVFRLE